MGVGYQTSKMMEVVAEVNARDAEAPLHMRLCVRVPTRPS
jgi:hypothetical protein